jgi:hypothetical protein
MRNGQIGGAPGCTSGAGNSCRRGAGPQAGRALSGDRSVALLRSAANGNSRTMGRTKAAHSAAEFTRAARPTASASRHVQIARRSKCQPAARDLRCESTNSEGRPASVQTGGRSAVRSPSSPHVVASYAASRRP